MDIALWIVSGLLAAMYLMAGFLKATKPKEELQPRMPWAEDFSPSGLRFIGVVEVLGAIGLVLPWLTGIAPVLTPLAALGLAIVQAGAIAVHLRRKETQVIGVNLLLLLLAAFVAVFRFLAL